MKMACECVNESIDENVQIIVRDRYHMLVVSRETQKLNANICVKCYGENGGKNWIQSQVRPVRGEGVVEIVDLSTNKNRICMNIFM